MKPALTPPQPLPLPSIRLAFRGCSAGFASPFLYVGSAAFCFMWQPLLVWAGTQHIKVVQVVAGMYITRLVVLCLRRKQEYLEDLKAVKPRYLMAAFICTLAWLSFATALNLGDPIIMDVIGQSWPLLYSCFTLMPYWRNRCLSDLNVMPSRAMQQTQVGVMCVLLLLGGVGVTLVALSQGTNLSEWPSSSWLGLALALISALFWGAGTAIAQLMGADQRDQKKPRNRAEVSLSGYTMAIAAMGLVLLTVSPTSVGGEGGNLFHPAGFFVLCLGAASLFAAWGLQTGLHLSADRYGKSAAKVMCISYLAPVGSLILLALFADSHIRHPELLIAGVVVVITTNLLSRFSHQILRSRMI